MRLSRSFNKLEKKVEKEYEEPSKRAVLRRVKRQKHLKTEKDAAKYIGKATAAKVKREQLAYA